MEMSPARRASSGMHTRLLVTWSLLAVGCGSSAVCTFNSDCPAGSFCEMGACRVECSPTQPCPNSGEVCTSFGECVPGDAGMQTDAGPRLDAGADGGPPPIDAGTDAGPPPEVCTPSTVGSVPEDEDADGAIDEDCEWHFGVPHPVIDLHRNAYNHLSANLSPDGLRLYFTSTFTTTQQAAFVATRPSLESRFGAPVLVAGLESVFVWGIALSPDELEAYLEVQVGSTQQIQRATRSSRSEPFGAPELVSGSDIADHSENHPYVSPDALELIFEVRGVGLHRMRRAATSDAFTGTAEALPLPGEPARGGTLSTDGLTLLFTRIEGTIDTAYLAERESVASTSFGAPRAVPELHANPGDDVSIPFYSPRTRELFFTSTRPWSPAVAIWRVEVCRDGPCPTREIDCPSPGVRSPDGLHCYAAGSTATWAAARTACETGGGHLATVHSRAEMDLLWDQFASMAAPWLWMGGYDDMGLVAECNTSPSCPWGWVSGEPWTFPGGWSPGEPSNSAEDCAVLWDGIGLGDAPCASSQVSICERDLWPTW